MGKLVKPENTLKKKVGHGGFKDTDLVKAQSMIEDNKIDFKPIAQDLLKELEQVLANVESGEVSLGEALGGVMYPLMQLRAQGSLFHYPTITTISDIVVDFLDSVGALDKDALEIVAAYRQAAQAMLKLGIKDTSNKVGQQLCAEIKAACARYRKAKNV